MDISKDGYWQGWNTPSPLKRHKPMCHGKEAEYACSDCGRVGKNENEIRKHIREDHVEELVRSREVCKHWRRGKCDRGDQCGFSHVGHQSSASSTTSGNTQQKSTRKPLCLNGKDCDWNKRGHCRFFHPQGRVHQRQEMAGLR